MKDYSLAALLAFCDQLIKDDPSRESVVRGWKTACKSVIRILPPVLQEDVRGIEPDEAMQAYRRSKPDGKEKTFREYHRRLQQALAAFTGEPVPQQIPKDESAGETTTTPPQRTTTRSQTIKVVLRSDFVAEMVVPYDVSREEGSLLSRYLDLAVEGSSRL